MQKSFPLARRVAFFRVSLMAAALVALPSFGLTPGGVEIASAQAVGAAKVASLPVRSGAALATASIDFVRAKLKKAALPSIEPEILDLAFGAATCAVRSGVIDSPKTMTIIDYSKPSTAKRLWVLNLQTAELLFEELVAHGQGSGANYATLFGNEPETHRTSIGLFVTDDTYIGRNGYSLRLSGLDPGFNDRARERAIVMHGAPYVSDEFARTTGRLGRSWGCPALPDVVARNLIDTVKGGGLVFAYYPDQKWLKTSKYLGDCAAAN